MSNPTIQHPVARNKTIRRRSPLSDRGKLEDAIIGAKSKKDVLINIGLRAAGGNFKTLEKYAKEFGITLPHDDHTKRTAAALKFIRIPDDEVFVENSTYSNGNGLKRRMLENGMPNECAICKQGPEWNGNPLVLQTDHVNGRNNDNRWENLRFLCPNCHAQTFSYRGYNIKPPKECECGAVINASSTKCVKCANAGRYGVEWPGGEDLSRMVDEIGYSATGRALGVSDNAVRKRMRDHPSLANS